MGIWHEGPAATAQAAGGSAFRHESPAEWLGDAGLPCCEGRAAPLNAPQQVGRSRPHASWSMCVVSVCADGCMCACVFSPRVHSARPGWRTAGLATARRAAAAPPPPAQPQSAEGEQGRAGRGTVSHPCSCVVGLGQATGAAWQLQTMQPGLLPQLPLGPRGLHLSDPKSKACPEPTCAAGDELNLRTNSASSSSRVSCGRQAG